MVKRGFSLVEALVVMAIVSILFAAAGKVMTQRPKPKKLQNPHGYFECYLDGATLKQSLAYEENVVEISNAKNGVCTFEPPKGVALFNINTYGKAFYSAFEPNVNNAIQIQIHSSGNDFITVSRGNDKFHIQAAQTNTSAYNDEKESAKVYFQAIHPKSQIYNNGNCRNGIMFSW